MSEWFSNVSGLVVTVGAVIAALGVIFKLFKGPIRRWLGIETTPGDVKEALNERLNRLDEGIDLILENQKVITDNQELILGMLAKFAEDETPTHEEVLEALQTLAAAGFELNDDKPD